MKKLYPKGNGAIFKLCVIFLIAAIAIIYGCKKEISRNKDATSTPAEKTIADAKAWYENTYRAGSSGQPVHTNSTGTGIDLSTRLGACRKLFPPG